MQTNPIHITIGDLTLLLAQDYIERFVEKHEINISGEGNISYAEINAQWFPIWTTNSHLQKVKQDTYTRNTCVLLKEADIAFGLMIDGFHVIETPIALLDMPLPGCAAPHPYISHILYTQEMIWFASTPKKLHHYLEQQT